MGASRGGRRADAGHLAEAALMSAAAFQEVRSNFVTTSRSRATRLPRCSSKGDQRKHRLIPCLNEAVIFSAEGAPGLKPGVERSGTPGTDLRADER